MIWKVCLVLVALVNMQLMGTSNQAVSDDKFINPIAEGADPWVIENPLAETADSTKPEHFKKRYYWCMSDANRRIAIYATDDLTRMGKKHIVWQAPDSGPYSRQVWAPELHYVDGHWYVYMAASDGDNVNHLAYVLKSKTDDVLSEYEVHGPLATGDGQNGMSPNVWAIDMTLLKHKDQLYAIWSGWDAPGTDRQFLYIAPMSSPTKLSGPRVRICANDDYLWERLEPATEHRGLNEGPEVLKIKDRTFLFYSCGASWLPTYKLGVLEMTGDNPLNPSSWEKAKSPAFQSSEEVYGVGHSCFVRSPDQTQWWHIYHAKRDRNPGWRRAIHLQPISIDEEGKPDLGTPESPSKAMDLPAGETPEVKSPPAKLSDVWRPLEQDSSFSFYGHHQLMQSKGLGTSDGKIVLGAMLEEPINDYRSGEKVLFDRVFGDDLKAEVTIDFHKDSESRDAGIVFFVSRPSVGFDAQQGYFAGLIPKTGLAILGTTNGTKWNELARKKIDLDLESPQKLGVVVQSGTIKVQVNGEEVIRCDDVTYRSGQIGLRVVDADATFSDLLIRSK